MSNPMTAIERKLLTERGLLVLIYNESFMCFYAMPVNLNQYCGTMGVLNYCNFPFKTFSWQLAQKI